MILVLNHVIWEYIINQRAKEINDKHVAQIDESAKMDLEASRKAAAKLRRREFSKEKKKKKEKGNMVQSYQL